MSVGGGTQERKQNTQASWEYCGVTQACEGLGKELVCILDSGSLPEVSNRVSDRVMSVGPSAAERERGEAGVGETSLELRKAQGSRGGGSYRGPQEGT